MAVLDRFTKILTREVHFFLGSEGLWFRVRKGGLSPGEKAWLQDHRDRLARELLARNIRSCGAFLLQTLWWAGYHLRLIPSEREARYAFIPTGQPTNEVDFPTLFQLYEVHHDEGVNVLLDACRIERMIRKGGMKRRPSWPPSAGGRLRVLECSFRRTLLSNP